MDIFTDIKDRNLIIHIKGEIDHHSSETIRDKAEKEYTRNKCKNMIFDFENVTFMDSSGIGMIIGRYKFIEGQGGSVAIIGLNDNLQRLYEISGLKKIIRSFDSCEAAIDSLG